MNNPEVDAIIASVQAAISRAYALGRLDALKHVVTAIEAEEAGSAEAKPLALMGPLPGSTAAEQTPAPIEASDPAPHAAQELPANDDAALRPAEEPIRLPWYRRNAG